MPVPNNADQTPSISRNTLIILRRTITNICSLLIKNNHVLIYINLHWVFYVLSPHGVYKSCAVRIYNPFVTWLSTQISAILHKCNFYIHFRLSSALGFVYRERLTFWSQYISAVYLSQNHWTSSGDNGIRTHTASFKGWIATITNHIPIICVLSMRIPL